jgi:predicted ABC-type ATPase
VLARTLVEAGAPAGETTERLAADLAENKRRELVAKRESFITETVFSDPVGATVQALRNAQAAGYTVAMEWRAACATADTMCRTTRSFRGTTACGPT